MIPSVLTRLSLVLSFTPLPEGSLWNSDVILVFPGLKLFTAFGVKPATPCVAGPPGSSLLFQMPLFGFQAFQTWPAGGLCSAEAPLLSVPGRGDQAFVSTPT